MRLVAAAAVIALSSLVGLTVAARAATNPSCPAAPSGMFLDPSLPTQSGAQGTIPWFRCNFTSTNQANGFFWVELQWATAGSTDTTTPGCNRPSTVSTIVASTSYWGFADFGGWKDAQSRQVALATAQAWLSALGGIARSCSASSGGGTSSSGSIRKECPRPKPVIKESEPVAERLTFAATHKGSPALSVNGAANLSSFYCFYTGGTHDRVGRASGLGTIVQTAPHAVSIGFSFTGFPRSLVKGGTITDTLTGRITNVSATSTCKVGGTITITIVKTRTASRVSFVAAGCGGYAFRSSESSVTLD